MAGIYLCLDYSVLSKINVPWLEACKYEHGYARAKSRTAAKKHCTARRIATTHIKIQSSKAITASYLVTNTNQLCRGIITKPRVYQPTWIQYSELMVDQAHAHISFPELQVLC